MDRLAELTKYVTKEKVGIEIGPWFSPVAPKRDGYQCLALDIFDCETLLEKAKLDPFIPKEKIANIEKVDLIGSSIEIESLVAKQSLLEKIDYIVSSHNFEHLPNPIRFLQGCEKVLKPGGMLTMAIPDLRTCFDYFRPISTLADWLEAYFSNRERPTFTQIFNQNTLHSQYQQQNKVAITFLLTDDPSYITPVKTLEESFDRWKKDLANQEKSYCDVHCSTFTPSSFELLISDLNCLGLTQLRLTEISQTNGCEFYVHLERPEEADHTKSNLDAFYEKRKSLLHRMINERSVNTLETFRIQSELKEAYNKIATQQKEMEQIKNENARRIKQLEFLIDTVIESKSPEKASFFHLIKAWFKRFGYKKKIKQGDIDII